MRKVTLLVAFMAMSTSGCATIMHGKSQDVGVSSTPTNAKVTLDNTPGGNTPMIAKLSRGANHIVKIELPGYQTFEATLTKKVSGWVWGNIVFGGIIGLAVDAITGGLYNLTPEQIAAQMARQGASVNVNKDGIYIVLVPSADAKWQKIGALEHR